MRADTPGHALFFVSVLRASSIPARLVRGLLCDPSPDLPFSTSTTSSAGGAKTPAEMAAAGLAARTTMVRAEFYSREVQSWISIAPATKALSAVPFGVDHTPYPFLPTHFDCLPHAAPSTAASGASAASPDDVWAVDWSNECNLKDGGRTTLNHCQFNVTTGSGVGATGVWVVPIGLGQFASDLIVRECKIKMS